MLQNFRPGGERAKPNWRNSAKCLHGSNHYLEGGDVLAVMRRICSCLVHNAQQQNKYFQTVWNAFECFHRRRNGGASSWPCASLMSTLRCICITGSFGLEVCGGQDNFLEVVKFLGQFESSSR